MMLAMVFSFILPGNQFNVQAEDILTVNADGYYELGSADDMLAFAQKVNAGEKELNAVLTNDIDMEGKTWIPITEYAGTFDGQNHKIKNLTFDSTDQNQGIFGTNIGTIENIADITGTYTENHANIGGLTAINKGKVVNCHSSVKIICNKNGGYVGGVVGYNITDTALVEKCSFEGTITIPADSTVSSAYIGGVVGRQRTGKPYIIGCVNRGTIMNENSKWMYIGGIAGYADGGNIWFSYNEGTLQAASTETYISGIAYSAKPYNCYSVGTLKGGKCYQIAPLFGTNNYYLSDAEEQGARTDEEFKKNSMVNALNALTTSMKSLVPADCMFEQSNGYPALVWEGKGIEVTPVAVKSATISGDALSGVTLAVAITGENDKEPTSVSYQWQVSSEEGYEDIADAVYPTFALPDTEAYVGKQLRVVVTGGNDSKVVSEPTSVIGKSDKLRVTEDKAELQSFASPILENCQLTLPDYGSNGSTITWESNKPEVISSEGNVILPAADKVSVSLKATITYNETTDTKTFSVQVQSIDYQDALADSNAIQLASKTIYEAQTLDLPIKGKNGSEITWTSNKTDYITNEGVVTLPATGTQSVKLTATITKNETNVTNTFWLTVYSTDKGNVTRDKDELSIQTDVREAGKIELPAQGKHGSTITWTSNNEDVIANDGTITLPESGVVSVTLKASIVSNETTATKSFTVKVCSKESQTKQVNVTFTLVGDDVHGANPHKAFYKWIDGYKTSYTEADQKTALDLIDDAFNEYGFQRTGSNSYLTGVITPDGVTLAQFMNGSGSGWMYMVNGKTPNFGMFGYKLSDGDEVKLYYVHSYQEVNADPIDTPVQTITLDTTEKVLTIGKQLQLSATVKPSYAANKNIVWTSSNEKVATVDENGIVTAKANGKAVISATAQDGNGAKAECTVEVQNPLEPVIQYLRNTAVTEPTVGSTGGEWAVLSLARHNVKDVAWYHYYYDQVVNTIKVTGNKLSNTKSTENSRVVIALTAIGADPTNINGENLLQPLADYDFVVKQGINGATYALIALDTANYSIPQVNGVDEVTTREKLIQFILGREIKDGGWAFGEVDESTTPDVDMTAMVIQALAPYYKTDEKVRESVDRGIQVLSDLQGDNGGYAKTSIGTSDTDRSSESIAQVICALSALGIDAQSDERFIKNDHSLLEAFLTFYDDKTGGFKHQQTNEEPDLMASEQAAYTLVAYDRLQNRQSGLYEMSDAQCMYICADNEHKWDSGKVTKPATELEKGIRTFTCTVCGTTKEEEIPQVVKKDDPTEATTEVTAEATTEVTTEVTTEPTTEATTEAPAKVNYSKIPLQTGKKTNVIQINGGKTKIKKATVSNKKIVSVTVKNGKLQIKAKKKGKAVITITDENGQVSKVTVEVKKSVPLKKLSLNKKKVTLKVNQKEKLVVTKNPVTAVTKLKWSTSNKKIATVDQNGKVKAKKKGKVTITVKASNGKKARCKVTVK